MPDIDREDPIVRRILEEIDFLLNHDNWGGAVIQLQKMQERMLVITLLIEKITKLGMEQRAEVLDSLEREAPQLARQLKSSLSALDIEVISVGELRGRIKTAISELKTGGPKVRELARRALVEIGAPSVKPLVDTLGDSSNTVRDLAYQSLILIGPPAIGPLTGAYHKDSNPIKPGFCNSN